MTAPTSVARLASYSSLKGSSMRHIVLASSLALALSACADAQDKPAETAAMPILSAANTIDACFQRHIDISARRTECVGAYADACMALTEGGDTTVGMVRCLNEEQTAWRRRGLASTEQLYSYLSEDGRAALDVAGRAWSASSDADCQFARHQFEGGTAAALASASCSVERAAERALMLDAWIIDFAPHLEPSGLH
jgi:uncharacterized protein YecT (DUF1311 family)